MTFLITHYNNNINQPNDGNKMHIERHGKPRVIAKMLVRLSKECAITQAAKFGRKASAPIKQMKMAELV